MRTCTRRPGFLLAAGLVVFFFLVPPSAMAAGTGATSCQCSDCHITVTINVAFFGADQNYIDQFEDEVENTWNGPPENPSTYGDCTCPFEVKVVTKTVTDCSKETDYHCIEVTNYTAKPPFSGNESVLGGVRNGTIDPKTSDQVTRHRGYLYPPGTSTGAPVRGWWSDAMSTPYSGQPVTDFAHEAGHLMGLADRSGGIMDFSGMTSGRVSQGNIDDAVKNLCGDKPCPDRCCCGNARVDRAKGEECDPLATPPGCVKGASCCPVCCRCQVPACDPEAGEYPTEEECKKNCNDKNDTCHINYYTGCWDCTGRIFIGINDKYQSTRETIWKADESAFHTPRSTPVPTALLLPVTTNPVLPQTRAGTGPAATTAIHPAGTFPPEPVNTTPLSRILWSVNDVPVAGDLLANERINIHLPEGGYHVTTAEGSITDSGNGIMTDPTVNVYSDQQTLEQIAEGTLSFEKAVSSGRVRFEGVGFMNSLKFTVSEYALKIKASFGSGG